MERGAGDVVPDALRYEVRRRVESVIDAGDGDTLWVRPLSVAADRDAGS